MSTGPGSRSLKDHAQAARTAQARARLRISRVRERMDPGLGLFLVAAILAFGTGGWVLARIVDTRGYFDPPVLTEIDDPRKLADYRTPDAPIVDMVRSGQTAVVGRVDGAIQTYDMETGLFTEETLPRSGGLSGGLSFLSADCSNVSDCQTPSTLFAVTDQGGLARRRGGRWDVVLSDSRWERQDGTPVEQDAISVWAVSDDGRWVLAMTEDDAVGLFDQTDGTWSSVAQTGAVTRPEHLVFAADLFWIGGSGGLEVIDPGHPVTRRSVAGVEGDVLDLEVDTLGKVLILTSKPCDRGASCLTIQSARAPGSVETLVGEDSVSPDLSNTTVDHAALQNGKFVVLGKAGIHVYDPKQRHWSMLVDAAVDTFHAGANGSTILYSAGSEVGKVQGGSVIWRKEAPAKVRQILPGSGATVFGLLAKGTVVDLASSGSEPLFPSDSALPGLDGITAATFWKDTLIGLRNDEVILHDPAQRRFQTIALDLPPNVSRSRLELRASDRTLWLIDFATGRIFEGGMQGEWPTRTLTFEERTSPGPGIGDVSADGPNLWITDRRGRPWRLESGGGRAPVALTGQEAPSGFIPSTAASEGGVLTFSDGRNIARYDPRARGWSDLYAGPDEGIADLALGGGAVIALSPDGIVTAVKDDQGWQPVTGSVAGADLSSDTIEDAYALGDRVYFGGNGKVMTYLPQDRRMGPTFASGRGSVRILGAGSNGPVWLSNDRLMLGDTLFSGKGERVLSAGMTGNGLVYMAEEDGRRYAVSREGKVECRFRGREAPGGTLVDALLLPDQRVFVATTNGLAIYNPRFRRWLTLTERGVSDTAQLAILHGNLVLIDDDLMQAIPLAAIPTPQSCDASPQDLDWGVTLKAAKIKLDRTGGQVFLLDTGGRLRRWDGVEATLKLPPNAAPQSTDLRRAYSRDNGFTMLAPDAVWHYDLRNRLWRTTAFKGRPSHVAEIDLTLDAADTLGVTVWDDKGIGYGGFLDGDAIPLRRLDLPVLPRPQQDPKALVDMAMAPAFNAFLGRRDLELFSPTGRDPIARIALPEPQEVRTLGFVRKANDLVLIEGPRAQPTRIHVIDRTLAQRQKQAPLESVSWSYSPAKDKSWHLASDRLWRIDEALVLYECRIEPGLDATQTCDPRTRPPFRVEPDAMRAAAGIGQSDRFLLLPDRLVRIDGENRQSDMAFDAEITDKSRLFSFARQTYFWEAPGRGLFRETKGVWQQIAASAFDIVRSSTHMGVTTPDGLLLLEVGDTTLQVPKKSGADLHAATMATDGGIWGLAPDGRVVTINGTPSAPVTEAFVPDPVKIAPGKFERQGRSTVSVLWSQAANGQITAEWDAPCAPLDMALTLAKRWGLGKTWKAPECRHYLQTDLALARDEVLLADASNGQTTRILTTKAIYEVDPASGKTSKADPWSDRLRVSTTDQATLEDLTRLVTRIDGQFWLAPPSLDLDPDDAFFVRTGNEKPGQTISGGRPLPIPPYETPWVSWDRERSQVLFGQDHAMSPGQAIAKGSFLPDAPGRTALVGRDRIALINAHGLWHFVQGAGLQPVSIAPLPDAVGLAHRRFLFAEGGMDAVTGQRSSDTNVLGLSHGALGLKETLRGGGLEATYQVSGRPMPDFAARGFVHDIREDVTVVEARVATLGPLGLVPALVFEDGQYVPDGTSAVDLDGPVVMAATPSGWQSLSGVGWQASDPPRFTETLVTENGRLWLRRTGVTSIAPETPEDAWKTARRGLAFDADRLVALAANEAGPVVITGAGTHAGLPTLASLIDGAPPVAADPGTTRLDSLGVSPGRSVIWAETDGGRVVWDRAARLWRAPAADETPWENRTAVETGELRVSFAGADGLFEAKARDRDGRERYKTFSWRRGRQMPFDTVRGMSAEGDVLLLATDFGLRRLQSGPGAFRNDGLYSGTDASGSPLPFSRVGRPDSNPDRLIAEAGATCFELASGTADPVPCADAPLSLERRALMQSSLWHWWKTDGAVDGTYLDASGSRLIAVPKISAGSFPHDQIRARISCFGTQAELWSGHDIVSLVTNGIPTQLTPVTGATGLHCQSDTAQLGRGDTLASGLYVGGDRAWRWNGGTWEPEPEAEAVAARTAGAVPWEAKRLRMTLHQRRLQLDYRWQDDLWREVRARNGRFAIDDAMAIGNREEGLQIYTPAGVFSWDTGVRRLDPDAIILRTLVDRDGFAACHARLVEAHDGTIQSVPEEPGKPVTLFCEDGKAYKGNPIAMTDAGAFKATTAHVNDDRVLIDTPIWQWERQAAGPTAAKLAITFKDEDVVLSGGRMSVDDYAGLAAPFNGMIELVTQADGWWRHSADALDVDSAIRAAPEANPRQATALRHDFIDGAPVLCAEGTQTIAMTSGGAISRQSRCRDWRGADRVWSWYVSRTGAEANGLSRNGIPMNRHLSEGRFDDLFVLAAPMRHAEDGRLYAPTRTGVLVSGPSGPEDIHASAEPGFLARDGQGNPVLLTKAGPVAVGEASDPSCAALADLPGRLADGGDILRVDAVTGNAVQATVQMGEDRVQFLVPCDALDDTLVSTIPVDIRNRGRFRASEPASIAPQLLITATGDTVQIRDQDGHGLTAPSGSALPSRGMIASTAGREVILAGARALFRIDVDRAISKTAGQSTSLPPLLGPFLDANRAVPHHPQTVTDPLRPKSRPPVAAPAVLAPSSPAAPTPTPPTNVLAGLDNTTALQLAQDELKTVQKALADLGHYGAKIDGITGPRTRAAISAWQAQTGYTVTGDLTERQKRQLLMGQP
ncbi:peptidoglycan-binding domain-containing protein [Phaeobacter sp. CAU 1743]|uniref:peptidoglycan-binding domain-containing protein n=1 Tax=Phaeobacter sp. CAU 1743 TaxID=3140367 RepID=UPI00325C1B5D